MSVAWLRSAETLLRMPRRNWPMRNRTAPMNYNRGSLELLTCVGIFAALCLLFGVVQTHRLKAEKAAYSAFRADVKSKSDEQIRVNERDRQIRNQLTDRREAEHATAISSLDAKYAAARVRNANPGSGPTQPLSQAASILACPDRQADAVRRLEQLESGVLALLQRGDKAIERTILCRDWLKDQVTVN